MSTKSSELFCKPGFLEAGSHVSDERENLNPKGWVCFERKALGVSRGPRAWPKCTLSFPIAAPSFTNTSCHDIIDVSSTCFHSCNQLRLLHDQRAQLKFEFQGLAEFQYSGIWRKEHLAWESRTPGLNSLFLSSKSCVTLREWLPLSVQHSQL